MIKNITNVRGIKCWGAHTGVKSMRRDLALIYSEVPASAAAVFTRNEVVAEPIKISKQHVRDGMAQAIVVNAGNANACTGEQGYEGAQAMCKTYAEELGIDEKMVLVASTGLIGEPFPTDDIVEGIKTNVSKLSSKSNAGTFAANAILTTDTFAKEGFLEFELGDTLVNMAGIAKGSGMIHPNMGTMLAFIFTDVAIEAKLLRSTVKEIVDDTFNMITIDGDTSTNDMVAVMANGLAENKIIESKKDPGYEIFRAQLEDMMAHLAKLIVSDGEGASKFIRYEVVNAKNKHIAKSIVKSIADSTLVKTAMFGRDPNWGRIICAAGNAGVEFDYTTTDLFLGSEVQMLKVLEKGVPLDYDKNFMRKLLRESHLGVKMDLGIGKVKSIALGSDLTTDYVIFNSVYTT
jgi:glutamate N-acetyltransferase/amino-acid N-acetyltransferase